MKKQSRWWKEENQVKILFAIMGFVLVAVLIPLFVIAHYNFQSVDDFGYAQSGEAVWEETHSVWKVFGAQIPYTWNYYQTWQGTFFGEWFTTSMMGIFSKNAYYMGTYLSLGSFVLAELTAFWVFLVKGMGADKYRAGIVAFSCIAFQVLLTPVPAEAYFWFCGAVLYTFTHALGILLVTLLYLFVMNDGRKKRTAALLEAGILFLTVAAGGSNYVTALTMLLLYCFFILWTFYRKHPCKIWMLCNGVVYLAAFLVNVLAPGNQNRLRIAGAEQISAWSSILLSLKEALIYIMGNTILPCVILGFMLAPVFGNMVKKKNFRYPLPVLVSLISYGVFAAQFTPTLYTLQMTGAGRILNLYRFNLYLLLFGNELYWIGWLWRRRRETCPGAGEQDKAERRSLLLPGWVSGGMLLCVSLAIWGGSTLTSVSALKSLRSGDAERYYEENQERLTILEDKSSTEVYLDPFSVKPYVLYFGDIVEDTGNWVNKSVADYFGKEVVGLKQE